MRPVLQPRQLPIRVWLVATLIALSSFTGFALPASITAHPADLSRCPGSGASFSVTATNPLTYQWQVNTGSGFEDIVDGDPYSGATTSTLNVSTLLDEYSGYQFQCVVTGVSGPDAVSNAATLTVAELLVDMTQTDASCNEASDGTATVSVTGGSGVYTYLWTETGNTGSTETDLLAGTYHCQVTDESGCTVTQEVIINEPSPIIATVSFTDISCYGMNDGAASVSVTGGAGSYSYYWYPDGSSGNAISGLAPDEYTVSITDVNGCGISENITITEPPQLVAVQSQDDVACPGGANGMATVTVSGGTGMYTYNWFPSGGNAATATDLAAGEYTCTITDEAGCSIFEYFTISEPVGPDIASTITDVLCAGNSNGKISLSVTGPGAPYSFYWTGSGNTSFEETGLGAGEYECQITDGSGCSVNETFTVAAPAALTATISSTAVSCFGASDGTATITPAGGVLPYTYSWLNGQTSQVATGLGPVPTGCFMTDANGCATYAGVTVSGPAALTAGVTHIDASCTAPLGSATLTAAGGTAPYTYAWSPSGGTGATASGLAPGTYTYTITDNHACSITSTVTIGSSVLVTGISAQTNVLCHGSNTGSATVTATGGSGIYTYSWSPTGGTGATATGLVAGTYTCTINSSDGCSTTETVTITEASSLAIAQSSTPVSCAASANGTATLVVSGGTPAYTYSWSNGQTTATATGLTKGIKSCFIVDQNGCASLALVNIPGPTALAVVTSQVDATCGGANPGSATVAVSGGTTPYNYSWSPSGGTAATATGLAAGAYTCTITDNNGCTITANVTITASSGVTATSTQNNVLCNGGSNGSATVTATGGSGIYTYSWAPTGGTGATATGLAAGTYTCTVNSSDGCSTTETVTITEPAALVAVPASTDITCSGASNGSASVSVTGGTGTYSYLWAPGGQTTSSISGMVAGTYTCTVTDANGCTVDEAITISSPSVLTTSLSQTNISCNGGANGSATVAASGGTGSYTYTWSPSGGTSATATGLAAGTYTATVTDANGCTAAGDVTLTDPSAIVLTGTSVDASCTGLPDGSASVSATGGAGSYTYSWSPSGGTSATATGLVNGSYTVTVTDANGCIATNSYVLDGAPLPTVDPVAGEVLCNNAATAPFLFTGSAVVPTTYNWVNDDASIGLPASGTGDIAAFVATNAGTSLVTATITVTPTANGCDGAPQVFTIAVKPTPGVAPVADQDICAGSGTTNIGIGGPVPGATYNWTNSNTDIGLPATGAGDILPFTALNATGNTLSATITIIPVLNGCTGAEEVFLINVNAPSAEPVAITASASELCGPGTVNLSVSGGSLGSGANWKWYTGSCGGTLAGTGAALSDVPVNTTTTYFVRAEGTCNITDCASTTVTVNSKPAIQLTSSGYLALQPGMTTKLTAAQTPVATGDVYTWYRNGEQVAGLHAATFNVGIDTRGAYKVKVSTALGCETISNEIVIRDSASSRLYVLPNPNNGMFKVRYYSPSIFYGKRHLTLYNARGELVYHKIFVVNDAYTVLDVNVMGVAQGVYFIIIGDASNRVLTKERLEIF